MLRVRRPFKSKLEIFSFMPTKRSYSCSLGILISYSWLLFLWAAFTFIPQVQHFYSFSSTRILEVYSPTNQENHLMSVLSLLQQDESIEKVDIIPVQEIESLIPYWVSFSDSNYTTPNYLKLKVKDSFQEEDTLNSIRKITAYVKLEKDIPWQRKISILIVFSLIALLIVTTLLALTIAQSTQTRATLLTMNLQQELKNHALLGTPTKKIAAKLFKEQFFSQMNTSLLFISIGFLAFYITIYLLFHIKIPSGVVMAQTFSAYVLSASLFFFILKSSYKKGVVRGYEFIAQRRSTCD